MNKNYSFLRVANPLRSNDIFCHQGKIVCPADTYSPFEQREHSNMLNANLANLSSSCSDGKVGGVLLFYLFTLLISFFLFCGIQMEQREETFSGIVSVNKFFKRERSRYLIGSAFPSCNGNIPIPFFDVWVFIKWIYLFIFFLKFGNLTFKGHRKQMILEGRKIVHCYTRDFQFSFSPRYNAEMNIFKIKMIQIVCLQIWSFFWIDQRSILIYWYIDMDWHSEGFCIKYNCWQCINNFEYF